jgi:hypothetical protein
MRNCLEYVLNEAKVKDGLIDITGPFTFEKITPDAVYQTFLREKRLWNKDSDRMYAHNIISFHKDELITPEQAIEFAKAFIKKWFSGFQTLISVHQDRDHLHIHLVTNTVSYIDGHKLHNTKYELEQMKKLTNEMCKTRGLSIAEKGKHFDGTQIEEGEIIAWSKDAYNLIKNADEKSFVVDCGIAVVKAKENCYSQEEFVNRMQARGWSVTWQDTKKNIIFENVEGRKVGDVKLSKTFSMNINKEDLLHEFDRQNELRLAKLESDKLREEQQAELGRYYSEVESAITRTRADTETIHSNKTVRTIPGISSFGDTDTFIESIEAANNNVRAAEHESTSTEQQRQLEEQQRLDTIERTTRYDGPIR